MTCWECDDEALPDFALCFTHALALALARAMATVSASFAVRSAEPS